MLAMKMSINYQLGVLEAEKNWYLGYALHYTNVCICDSSLRATIFQARLSRNFLIEICGLQLQLVIFCVVLLRRVKLECAEKHYSGTHGHVLSASVTVSYAFLMYLRTARRFVPYFADTGKSGYRPSIRCRNTSSRSNAPGTSTLFAITAW